MPVTIQPATLKYKNSNGVFQVADCLKGDQGIPGDPTQLIDDTAGAGVTDKTLSASKLTSEFTALSSAINGVEESIAPVESTATATAAHAVGELFMLGETLMVALSAIAVGDTITTTGNSPNAAVTTLSAKMIKDVQVNGSSVLSNGVANIPVAGQNSLGVVGINSSFGIKLNDVGNLRTDSAGSATIKAGTNGYQPLVPLRQHESVFYGMATAAGADMASVSGATVGVYPEAQKKAIRKMLGIRPNVAELIADYTVNEDSDLVEITTDTNGNGFKLINLKVMVELPALSTGVASNFLANMKITLENDTESTYGCPTLSTGGTNACKLFFDFELYGSELVKSYAYRASNFGSTTQSASSYVEEKSPKYVTGFRIRKYSSETSSPIPQNTKIRIYGIRYDE